MGILIIFNLILILIIAAALVAVKKWFFGERAERVLFLVVPILTILCHYSLVLYHALFTGEAITFIKETPNMILPLYPCNVVMWCALIYGLLPHKEGKCALFLSDYIFWFGLISTLVGMFANVDFIMNPTLADFEVTKSIVAHATLLFNVLLIPLFGHLRPSFGRNMRNIFISVVAMYLIGLYCNLVFTALASPEVAYDENAMFILHSPFEGAPFLRYPFIAAVGLAFYFILFTVYNILTLPRGERWYERAFAALRKK